MCGRKTLSKEKREIIREYSIEEWENSGEYSPSYNIAPTNNSPVLIDEDSRKIKQMKWGLIPFWADNENIGKKMIKARSETLQKKTSFKPLIENNRCVIIADGYYEWKGNEGNKQPFYIHKKDHSFISMAGLWSKWRNKSKNETIYTYTIITTPASKKISSIHNRMPAIIPQNKVDQWINKEIPYNVSASILGPYNELTYYPVSKYVNSVSNDSPKCIKKQRLMSK